MDHASVNFTLTSSVHHTFLVGVLHASAARPPQQHRHGITSAGLNLDRRQRTDAELLPSKARVRGHPIDDSNLQGCTPRSWMFEWQRQGTAWGALESTGTSTTGI